MPTWSAWSRRSHTGRRIVAAQHPPAHEGARRRCRWVRRCAPRRPPSRHGATRCSRASVPTVRPRKVGFRSTCATPTPSGVSSARRARTPSTTSPRWRTARTPRGTWPPRSESRSAGRQTCWRPLPACRQAPIVLITGSSEVYGAPAMDRINEAVPPRPVNLYGATKLAQEAVALTFGRARDVPVVATRSFNHIGPGQRPPFAIASFAVAAALHRRGRSRAGPPGRQPRPVARLQRRPGRRPRLSRSSCRGGHAGEPINVASGVGRSIRSVVDAPVRASGLGGVDRGGPVPRARRRPPADRRRSRPPPVPHRLAGRDPDRADAGRHLGERDGSRAGGARLLGYGWSSSFRVEDPIAPSARIASRSG